MLNALSPLASIHHYTHVIIKPLLYSWLDFQLHSSDVIKQSYYLTSINVTIYFNSLENVFFFKSFKANLKHLA